MQILCQFDRIGRVHDPDHVVLEISPELDLGEAIAAGVYQHAKKYLASRDYVVKVYANGEGQIFAGARDAGSFTWRKLQ